MKRLFLSTAAVLVIGLGAVHAQSDREQRGSPSAQPRSEESRPAAQPADKQRAPQKAQSNEKPAAGSGSAGRDAAQRPADPERSATDTRSKDTGKASDRARSGAAPADRDRSAGERRQDRASERASRRDRDAVESRRSSETAGTEQRSRAAGDRTNRSAGTTQSTQGDVSLSGEQRERVGARFAARIDSMNVRPVSRSSLSVSVGATVPSSVRLYAVPADVVSIYPRFRGHQFVMVEDEIVIIEPRTRRIVTTIPRSGSAQASRSSRTTTGAADSGTRIQLSPEQRQVIRTIVVREPACRFEPRIEFFIGIPLPTTAQVCEFPERIVSEVPEVRRYRYTVRGEEVVVVDPDERRVVEVIR